MHPSGIVVVTEPKEKRWNPVTAADCQFSLPYIAATAAITGRVFIESYTEAERARTDVRELMGKVTANSNEKLPIFSAIVTITLADGTKYIKPVDHVKGSPQNPMSWDEVISVFKGSTVSLPKAIPEANLNQVAELVENLEDCQDVTEIITLLIP